MLGTFINPTRWFWDGTRRELLQVRFRAPPTECFRNTVASIPIIAFIDGYVSFESDDKELVAKHSNAFLLSLTLLTGTTCDPVTAPSLESLGVGSDGVRIRERYPLVLVANFVGAYNDARKEIEQVGYDIVGTDELGVVCEFASAIMGFDQPSLVIRHLEVLHQRALGFWTTSVALGWMSIEQVVDGELMMQYIQEGLPREQAKKKVGGMRTSDALDELLARTPISLDPPDPTILTSDVLKEFHVLRKLRNEILHTGREATTGEADRMKDSADRAMWRILRQQRVHYHAFLDRVLPMQQARKSRLSRL